MAEITIVEKAPRCRLYLEAEDREMTVDEIIARMQCGPAIGLYVDGWSAPWPLHLGQDGRLRAQCPTAPKVRPLVVWVEQEVA